MTGALGGAGSWIVDRLRATYDVVAVDRTLPESDDVDGVDFRAVDLTDQGAVWETVLDADPAAVVHFGNIPREEDHPAAPWNGYGTSKPAGETAAERVTNAFDAPVASVRPSWIRYPEECEIASIREEFSTADAGRVALTRGPLVHCAEDADDDRPVFQYAVDADGDRVRHARRLGRYDENVRAAAGDGLDRRRKEEHPKE